MSDRFALPCLIQENAPLARFNTFGVEAKARWLVRLRVPQALPDILRQKQWEDLPVLILGDGSNVLFRNDWDGLIVKLDCQRVDQVGSDDDAIYIRAEAGRNWHQFVLWSLEHNLSGLENLSLIPGTVGAAPIQNIGAYGVEIESMIDAVEAYDLHTGEFVSFSRDDCGFGYRSSRFKIPDTLARYVVTSVRFRFPYETPLVTHYPGVLEELAAMGFQSPGPKEVSEAICSIRRRKLPDPVVIGNVGSFFKNPTVSDAKADELLARYPLMPLYPSREEGSKKLSAAWLLDNLGLKGTRSGDAGVSDTHALVLVNHGRATGRELFDLATRLHDKVRMSYGIELEPEPLIV